MYLFDYFFKNKKMRSLQNCPDKSFSLRMTVIAAFKIDLPRENMKFNMLKHVAMTMFTTYLFVGTIDWE